MYAFAPSAAAVLADWGADVIKVVPPKVADPMMGTPIAGLPERRRRRRVHVGDHQPGQALHRRRRRRTDDGRAGARRPRARAPTCSSPTSCRRAARGSASTPTTCCAVNPALVYAPRQRARAEGPSGTPAASTTPTSGPAPASATPPAMVADEFVPQPGPAMGDLSAGRVPRRRHRRRRCSGGRRTGRGAVVDVSLLSSGMWVCAPGVVASQLYGVDTIPRVRHARPAQPARRRLRHRATAGSIYLAGIQTERHFENFCEVVGRPDLLDDPRFATGASPRWRNAARVHRGPRRGLRRPRPRRLGRRARRPSTPWTVVQTRGRGRGRPAGASRTTSSSTVEGAAVHAIRSSPARRSSTATPPALTPAPDHGEHTEEVLLELGRTWDEIAELKARDAVL